MKTTAILFTAYGNTGLVQIRALSGTTIQVKPGGPEMKSGGLVISEANDNGVVGKLTAINNTSSFLLLTDADVLIGAKQNRIINKSMLLAPLSKTSIDVSCIERLRWNYTSRDFSSPGSAADHDLRKAKMVSMLRKKNECMPAQDTQSAVWSHINNRLKEEDHVNVTESYYEMASVQFSLKADDFPQCEAENGCNGIGIVVEGKVMSIDIFGSEELYRYYFPLLRDSAFRMAGKGKNHKPADMHESYFKVLDSLDVFEGAERKPDEQYIGAGLLSMAEKDEILGFDLTLEGQMIHQAIFSR
jgi:hypothetical protein